MDIKAAHDAVRNTYNKAAVEPQPGLCCPKDYDATVIDHIPSEAFEFNYGCGSPVHRSKIQPGEHVLDLGSGVGIDCFVAARLTGPSGRVTGVDLTPEMLEKARSYAMKVGDNLGYHNIRFFHGQIENIPLPDKSVDVVISNCVINLAADKKLVFQEIVRVLKPGGRVVIADIVSDRRIHPRDQADARLWGECYTGALSARDFIQVFHDAGLSGITQLAESTWEEVNGYRFSSLTIEAYRLPVGSSCEYQGQRAIYLGPYAVVEDDAGHVFPRFQPVEVCSDTAMHLKTGPYAGSFLVTGPTSRRSANEDASSCCSPSTSGMGGCDC